MYFPRLEDLRVDHDKTQIQIAEYLNLNREVYHTSTDYLLGRTDNPSPPHA